VNVVDGFNKEGQEVISDDEDEEDEDDEDEDEDDEDDDDEEGEEGEKLPGAAGQEEGAEFDSEDDDDDEEGEDEDDEDDEDEEGDATAEKSAGLKRSPECALEKGGSKRQNQEISS
jgi:hypothetical protein